MIVLFSVIIAVSWSQVDSAVNVPCTMSLAEDCMKPFLDDYERGVGVFTSTNITAVALVCRKYDVTSKCISPLLYYCPDINKKYKEKLDQFEYACSHQSFKDENWPLMPFEGNNTSNEMGSDMRATAIKAGVAAGVTVILIMICVMADCVSKWRIRRRVQKATAAAAAAQDAALIKNAEDMAVEAEIDNNETKKV